MKLIKINTDHYIIVDDSEIKEKSGDWFYSFETGKIYDTLIHHTAASCKKITHSTQPLEEGATIHGVEHKRWVQIKYIYLDEVKELIGEVDVEKKAFKHTNPLTDFLSSKEFNCMKEGYVSGYNQALEDNKDRKYTEEDIHKALSWGYHTAKDEEKGIRSSGYATRFFQSLQSQTEWEIEIIDGQLKLK